MFAVQSLAVWQGDPIIPLEQRPALLPPVAQRNEADVQSVSLTHHDPSAPSVHSPRPRPTL